MTIAEWCVLAAVLVYLFTISPVKVAGHREFDNRNPRAPEFFKPGIRARALGAHLNGIETFPFFAFAVLLAEFRHTPQATTDALAIVFVGTRLLFVLAYLADRSTVRSLLWIVGFLVNLAIFLLPVFERGSP